MSNPFSMTRTERRASASLSFIVGLRLLGAFLLMPVFAIEARHLEGGNNLILVGFALGAFGLTQSIFQTPFGIISDHFGRKRTIAVGFVILILGTIICACATTIEWLIVGRLFQGAGAISGATIALLCDQTRDEVRTKALAMVGISFSLTFAVSMIVAPVIGAHVGLSGLFWIIATAASIALISLFWLVPKESPRQNAEKKNPTHWSKHVTAVLRNTTLLRLNFGVFILHGSQMAMWMAVPALLIQSGIHLEQQWEVYLPSVIVAIVIMGSSLFRLERKGYHRAVYLFAIGLMAIVYLLLMCMSSTNLHHHAAIYFFIVLCLFFTALNILEAQQPGWVARHATHESRGTALGIYNAVQSLGLFSGGLVGGAVIKNWGIPVLFGVCAIALLIWLALAWRIRISTTTSNLAANI